MRENMNKSRLLEVIEIRCSAKEARISLEHYLNKWVEQINSEKTITDIRIYKHLKIDTDFSIHLQYNQNLKKGADALGEQLADELKDYGLVNRALWIEQHLKDHS
ncbi:MAG: hypothetical protein J7K46_07940 [Bacteroidales bacterium]|nr:hypothetical protein [Bacteroidales bacterium]